MLAMGATVNADPAPKPAAVSPAASPRWSGNHFSALPIAVPYTTPAPRPANAYEPYRAVSDSAFPLPTQPSPARTPPSITRSLGPNLSTSHPSNGTSQVSSRTNTVNVTWISACSCPRCFCSGGTKSVHPYWKFATATMLKMLKNRTTQRFPKKLGAWDDDSL